MYYYRYVEYMSVITHETYKFGYFNNSQRDCPEFSQLRYSQAMHHPQHVPAVSGSCVGGEVSLRPLLLERVSQSLPDPRKGCQRY